MRKSVAICFTILCCGCASTIGGGSTEQLRQSRHTFEACSKEPAEQTLRVLATSFRNCVDAQAPGIHFDFHRTSDADGTERVEAITGRSGQIRYELVGFHAAIFEVRKTAACDSYVKAYAANIFYAPIIKKVTQSAAGEPSICP